MTTPGPAAVTVVETPARAGATTARGPVETLAPAGISARALALWRGERQLPEVVEGRVAIPPAEEEQPAAARVGEELGTGTL